MANPVRSMWIALPVLLSIIFAVLFYPVVSQSYGQGASVGLTVAGICVIWVVYFVRAYVFARMFETSSRNKDESSGTRW